MGSEITCRIDEAMTNIGARDTFSGGGPDKFMLGPELPIGDLLVKKWSDGQANPKAGWTFWHGFNLSGDNLVVSGRVETKGPYGDDGLQTSNRAELRAVIAVLGFRFWAGGGIRKLVIATDSDVGGSVKDKNLWEALLGEIEKLAEKQRCLPNSQGMAVELWRIPREWNTVTDAAAKTAAA
ncbi:hypothetical protein B0H63DRAFT_528631 [Podospora didyma]|uniref:RNase H type-1 domain-containing protein n=1 Tax=Podospora didyma TaxID=330526 RepID=A0AAE0K293_9PEZI|nr:hypothetical protein B0H63DRAFT_528631 [Podospora didyma]